MQVFIWTAEPFKIGHLGNEVKSKHKQRPMCHGDFNYYPNCPSFPIVS